MIILLEKHKILLQKRNEYEIDNVPYIGYIFHSGKYEGNKLLDRYSLCADMIQFVPVCNSLYK
jgi:hypothetical protein